MPGAEGCQSRSASDSKAPIPMWSEEVSVRAGDQVPVDGRDLMGLEWRQEPLGGVRFCQPERDQLAVTRPFRQTLERALAEASRDGGADGRLGVAEDGVAEFLCSLVAQHNAEWLVTTITVPSPSTGSIGSWPGFAYAGLHIAGRGRTFGGAGDIRVPNERGRARLAVTRAPPQVGGRGDHARHATAQQNLGVAYALNRSVPQDDIEAYT